MRRAERRRTGRKENRKEDRKEERTETLHSAERTALPGKKELREEILHLIDGHNSWVSDEEVYREIDRIILASGRGGYGTLSQKEELRRQMFCSIRGFDILERYLNDDTVSEIMVIGASKIFVEQSGRVRRVPESFLSEEEVYRLIEQIVAPSNRMVNEASPIVDSRLPDGSRVHVVLPPVSLEGPVVTIRKFLKGGMTIDRLLEFGEFPKELTGIMSALVKGKYNILISGSTNSGKSSLLNAMAEYIGERERIITIEDSAELQLFHVDNLVRLETRNANMEGLNEITMQDLIKASLRMRPDRIIVGEVRGKEATAMLQALSTGHSGSFSSIHANSCRDALRRLETMVLMGMDMPLGAIQGLIASSIDILIHLGRLKTGKRKLLEICEVEGYDHSDYQINTLFRYETVGKSCGRKDTVEEDDESSSAECQDRSEEEGIFRSVGRLFHVDKLKSYGQYEAYCQAMEGFIEKEERIVGKRE